MPVHKNYMIFPNASITYVQYRTTDAVGAPRRPPAAASPCAGSGYTPATPYGNFSPLPIRIRMPLKPGLNCR